MDGHLSSLHQLKGGQPPKESVLKTWNLALRLLWMVTFHPQDGHSPSLGRSPTKQNMVTNLPEDGQPFSKYGHQPSPGCSTTIARRVTNHPKFGHEGSCPSSLGESPTVSRIWLHTIPMKVTHQQYKANHHPQDCYHLSQHSHPSSQGWSTRLGV